MIAEVAASIGHWEFVIMSFREQLEQEQASSLPLRDPVVAQSGTLVRTVVADMRAQSMGCTVIVDQARVLGLLLNSVFLDTLDWDAATLRRINYLVDHLPPEVSEREGLRHVDLMILRPSRDIGKLAGDFEMQLPRALSFLVRGLGTPKSRNADFVSYLLFESEYLRTLVELGEADAEANWERLEPFLS